MLGTKLSVLGSIVQRDILNFGPSFIDCDNPLGFRRNLEREFIIIFMENLRWSSAFGFSSEVIS